MPHDAVRLARRRANSLVKLSVVIPAHNEDGSVAQTVRAITGTLSDARIGHEVIVVDAGRIVERGPHAELVRLGGVYAKLHDSWVAQQQAV